MVGGDNNIGWLVRTATMDKNIGWLVRTPPWIKTLDGW
jgi:hypothetical protein